MPAHAPVHAVLKRREPPVTVEAACVNRTLVQQQNVGRYECPASDKCHCGLEVRPEKPLHHHPRTDLRREDLFLSVGSGVLYR